MKKIRLILVEDNRLLREGIDALLKKEPDIITVAALSDKEFSLQKIEQHKPHVILIDLGLAHQNSLKLVRSIKSASPRIKIIIMDLVPVQEDILRFVSEGVSGFILKDASISSFTDTIRRVAKGEKVLPPVLADSLFSQIMEFGVKELGPKKLIRSVMMTKRESEIVDLITEGYSNKKIAAALNLSIYTVKSHVHNILEKMALNTRVQIAIHHWNDTGNNSQEE